MRKHGRSEVPEQEELGEGREERALWKRVWQTSFGSLCFLFNHHGLSIPSKNHRLVMGQVYQCALTPFPVVGYPLFPAEARLQLEQPAGVCCLPTRCLL